MNETLINHSKKLNIEAHKVLESLNLISLWRKAGGNPFIVGALAYDLALSPDIDMEIFCENPKIEDGFRILNICAHQPGCLAARFRNEMDEPDQGYYWQIKYQQPDGYLWKIDMWSIHLDHTGPTSQDMIVPMNQALGKEKRQIILSLKQALINDKNVTCPSIFIYQAVLADGIHKYEDLLIWLSDHDTTGINDWRQWLPEGNLTQG